MDKMGYPKGLVRYTTQNAINHGWSKVRMLKRFFRPRVVIYTTILWTLILVLGFSLMLRTPMKVDVVKDRSMPRITQHGEIENVYRLQIMNATELPQELHIQVRGVAHVKIESEDDFEVGPAMSRWVAVRVAVPFGSLQAGSHKIWFDIENDDETMKVTEASVFLVPR
jgi:polyferredoxin